MAAPARPNFNVDDIANVTVYQSLDAIDEAIFNGLTTQYERAAFIDVINIWRGQFEPGFTGVQVVLTNGNDIQALWSQKRQYRISVRKKKAMRPKPAMVADTPIPAAAPPPAPPAPPALPALPPPTVIPPTALTLSAIQSLTSQPSIPAPTQTAALPSHVQPASKTEISGFSDTASSRRSSSSGGELEPPFLGHNDPDVKEYLPPTKERRRSVSEELASDLDGGRYRFAGVLAQSRAITRNGEPHPDMKSNCLFVRHGTTGLIEEQIAVKIVELTRDGELREFTQREIKIYDLLKSTNCSHVIGYRGYRWSRQDLQGKTITRNGTPYPRQTYYIYSDYAAMGDLTEVCKAHHKHKIPVPEYFIWYVMQVLVEALITLRDGSCSAPINGPKDITSSTPTPASPWRPILHMDIKAANVFLYGPTVEYPLWPRSVLSDFDTAIRLESEENKRSAQERDFRYTGTLGWVPPERNLQALDHRGNLLSQDHYPPHGWRITEKTDVWDIGVLAYVLTKAHETDEDLEAKCREARCSYVYNEGMGVIRSFHEMARSWRDDLKHRYILSDETACPPLENLSDDYNVRLYKQIQKCMRLWPEARPTLEDLKRDIDREMMRLKYRYGPAMNNEKDRMHGLLRVHPREEKWQEFSIGQAYQSPRKRRKVALPSNMTNNYKQSIENWADEAMYPRPTLDEQAVLSQSIENFYFTSDLLFITKKDPATLSKRHFCAMLKKRADPKFGLPTEVLHDYKPGTLPDNAFTDPRKTAVLQDLLSVVIPALQTDKNLGNPALHAINAFTHAVEWGLLLLQARGEPSPSLRERTLLHRGVYDYIFPESDILKRLKG